MFGRTVNRADLELVAAVEALLAGRYVEYLEDRGGRVPAWAWTNLLAQGDEKALGRAGSSRHRSFWELNVWRRARSYLAGEVLDAATRAGSLVRLQAEVLVPLELDLVSWVPTRRHCAGSGRRACSPPSTITAITAVRSRGQRRRRHDPPAEVVEQPRTPPRAPASMTRA